MPIYEYKCTKCHHHFEITQKITDEPKAKCPKCDHDSKRLISQVAFTLKGGGWYKDGYSSKSTAGNTAGPACNTCPKNCDAKKTETKK